MANPSARLGAIGIYYGGRRTGTDLDGLTTSEAIDAARLIERLGFGAVWFGENVGRDPFVFAAILLANTERLTVALGIANIYARDPMTMVAAQKTLSEAFPDRFLLGLGVSHTPLVTGLRQHDSSKPYERMVGYLKAMDESVYMAVEPATPPGRVLAALGPRMLALSADRASGAHPYLTTPEHTKVARDILGPDHLLAPEQMVVFETDPGEARRISRDALDIYLTLPNYTNTLRRLGFSDVDLADGGSDHLVDSLVAWGTDDAIARRIADHHAAGADHVGVQALHDGTAVPEQEWRRLAALLQL